MICEFKVMLFIRYLDGYLKVVNSYDRGNDNDWKFLVFF